MNRQMEHENSPVTVSIIMPAYNAADYIEAAIRSVMTQTLTDWELYVIDDCSPDATVAVAERLAREDRRITVLRNENNMGVSRTRNRGLDLCRGRYVAFLDSDDIWLPEKLEKQIALLTQKKADIAYCSYAIIDGRGNRAKPDYLVPDSTTFTALTGENVIGCSTVMLTAEIAGKYRFKTDFYHEDYVLWLQLLQDGYRAVGCSQVLVQWRYLNNSRSFDKRRSAKNRWKIYRNQLHLSLWDSLRAFGKYAVSGAKKYFRN